VGNVVLFKPRETLSAEQQAQDFIAHAKRITAFDHPTEPLDWKAVNWAKWLNISFVKQGVASHRLRSNASVPLSSEEILDDEIIEFAKAYTLYCQALNKTGDIREVPAVRALEKALLELRGSANITLVDETVLDRAAGLIQEHNAKGRDYRVGQALQRLAEFLTEMKLIVRPLNWINPIKRAKDIDRGHRERAEDAKKKLPAQASLDALAEIFASRPTSLRDVVTSSSAAMLICAPSRIGELVETPLEPFIEKETKSGKKEVFVQWYGEKGFGHHDKPIPETMAPLYKEAVKRIKELTEEPRALASWLEENPNEFPSHPKCPKVDQEALLTPAQTLAALNQEPGRSSVGKLNLYLETRIRQLDKDQRRYPKTWQIMNEAWDSMKDVGNSGTCSLTLRKLNIVLREYMLPSSFPYVSDRKITKYSEALFCFFANALAESMNRPTLPFSLMQFDNNTVNIDLTRVPASRPNGNNLFTRWGYVGEGYTMTTHQFRHWLNTIAQKGQVGQVEIARWSGRADISQNAVYNHRTPEDQTANMRKVGLGSQSSNLAERSKKNEPILVSEIGGDEHDDRISHVTLYGRCDHNFAMEPCNKWRGCITCKKHKCIKGDDVKLERLKFERDKMKPQLEKALKGAQEGFYGADRWLNDFMNKYEAANQLIALLEDPNIENGAVIQATDDGYTPLNQALEMRGESKDPQKPALEAPEDQKDKKTGDLKRLMGLLGR
jgi:hypothetical protein